MKKNWKALAAGNGIDLSDEELARITPALDAIEAAFRPLAGNIPHEVEPAVTLSEAAIKGQ